MSLLFGLITLIYTLLFIPVSTMTIESQQKERTLIINGEIAKKGRYPYFITLQHYGGGALIAPDIILTAGHTKPLHKHDVKPHVGTYDFDTDIKGVDYEVFEIVKSIRRTDFVGVNEDDFIRDFTILKLNGQSTHPIVKINRNHAIPHDYQQVTAMGVGDTSSNPKREKISNVLRQVNLNVISNAECELAHSDKRNLTYHDRIYPSMMCTTGGPHNERDSCSYDSGSPIIIPNKKHGDLLVGLVSWGQDCADPDFPAVNARVSRVSDWIDEIVCKVSDNPPPDFCRQPWKFPFLAGSSEMRLLVVAVMVGLTVVGLVVFRTHQGKMMHKKVKQSSPTLTEQESLCDSSASSEDYQAIEMEQTE